MYAAALLGVVSFENNSASVTAGLKLLPDRGPKVSIKAKRTNPTAIAFMNTDSAKLAPRTSIPSIPGEIAAMTRNIEPTPSAIMLCLKVTKSTTPFEGNGIFRL